MNKTKHAEVRQNQRGISSSMVQYALRHGKEGKASRVIFGKKEALERLKELQEEERLVKKMLDKGGVVVVADGENIITTYNCTQRQH
jgi:hypothetical protein